MVSILAAHATAQEPDNTVHVQDKADVARSEYQKWVQRYASTPLLSWFGDETSRVKLVLTAIEGDEQEPNEGQRSLFSKTISYGCRVSTGGRVSHFYRSALGVKGGGYPQITETNLKRLDQLLTQLPDDGSHLPPAGRRLVVQVAGTDQFQVRVYDRANAPAPVLEILRLAGSGIGSWLPTFQPVSQWTAHESSNDVALSLSPDGRFIVSASMHGPLKFWSLDTHEKVREVATPSDVPASGLSLSPDGSIAVLEGWGKVSLLDTRTWQRIRQLAEPMIQGKQNHLSAPQFTPDGRFLLLQSTQPALLIFDTKSWERLETLPGLPQDALSYVPAPGTNRAITLSKSGTVALWDTQQQREIAKLDHDARIHRVALSPDKSLVAVATVHKGSGDYWSMYRIRIWKADTGALVHELKTFERNTCEAVEGLLWSPDSRYVLAATKADAFFSTRGIGVWSAASGRHRGEFSGCPTDVTGLVLLADGRLIAGCNDGIIRIWDAANAFKEINTFEKSLSDEVTAPTPSRSSAAQQGVAPWPSIASFSARVPHFGLSAFGGG